MRDEAFENIRKCIITYVQVKEVVEGTKKLDGYEPERQKELFRLVLEKLFEKQDSTRKFLDATIELLLQDFIKSGKTFPDWWLDLGYRP